MKDRWDTECQEILVEAKRTSIELENYFLGTEHVAIAMLLRPRSLLRTLLESHRVDAAEFLDVLYQAATPGPLPQPENIALTPRIRQVVREADERARSTDGPIAETHLLGALLASGRGVLVRVLEVFDLQAEQLLTRLGPELEERVEEAVPGGTVPVRRPDDLPEAPPAKRPRDEEVTVKRRSGKKPVAHAREPEVAAPFPLLPLGGSNPVLLDWGVQKSRPSKKGAAPPPSGLLERVGRDITAQARDGTLPEILGRENEIEQLQRALCRASRNNPLLIGEPGVGKTAIVEGLAQRIVLGNVPNALRDVRVVEIAVAALTAETRYRGELEERLLQLVDEVRRLNVVLLIDEAESLGQGQAGQPDAGSVLRPFLARGDVRLIGTTTPGAFARTIERDTALLRCFHPIKIAAPDGPTVLGILQSVRQRFEDFHEVRIPEITLHTVMRQAATYLKQRQMPDAAIDLLDEACVKAASMSGEVSPASGWGDRPLSDHQPLRADSSNDDGCYRTGEREPPLVRPEEVAAVVSQRTGIPVETLTREERERISHMEDDLRGQVIGQDDAVRRVSERIRMYKAGFREERRPLGVFLFLGPTGVGKTELAKAIARFLFNSEDHLYRLDMSEYSEPHEVARLIGPPPGYIGYGEEGQLTASVRRDPHCVVLLDEIEKAHPKVFDLFLQVFDEGRLTDGKGVTADFTHAIIVLTSNLGADLWKGEKRIGFRQEKDSPPSGRGPRPNSDHQPLRIDSRKRSMQDTVEAEGADERDEDEEEARRKRIFETLKKTFRLEFLNRLDEVILFRPLEPDVIRAIARQMVGRWQARSAEQGHPFEVDDEVLEFLCKKGFEPEMGARPMKRAIEQYVVGPLSRQVLDERFVPDAPVRAVVRGGRIAFEQSSAAKRIQ